jgi:hypothetical protein
VVLLKVATALLELIVFLVIVEVIRNATELVWVLETCVLTRLNALLKIVPMVLVLVQPLALSLLSSNNVDMDKPVSKVDSLEPALLLPNLETTVTVPVETMEPLAKLENVQTSTALLKTETALPPAIALLLQFAPLASVSLLLETADSEIVDHFKLASVLLITRELPALTLSMFARLNGLLLPHA